MSDVLREQKRYYAERAPEYDDWWYRRGRYELEPGALARWRADVAEAEAALEAFPPVGTVLELAAGTGIWTRKLVRLADRVVAVDANAETLALNTADAELVRADVFEWEPAERFDLVFFSFWLSHVPEERFDEFWSLVRAALGPERAGVPRRQRRRRRGAHGHRPGGRGGDALALRRAYVPHRQAALAARRARGARAAARLRARPPGHGERPLRLRRRSRSS